MELETSTSTTKPITGQAAKDTAASEKKASTIGKQTTDRGTLITKSNNEFDSKSFLKIMTAELKNLDPSASQDNTQYVTQMAQFTSMQQMNNLNDTMTTSSYEGLIGKGVTLSVNDKDGNPYTGIVRAVAKENNEWYLWTDVTENGKIVHKEFDASSLKSVLGATDYTNSNMLINSNFLSASNLASDKNNKVILLHTDTDGKESLVKGTVKSAFLDNGIVKIRVAAIDADGNEATTTTNYPYAEVVKAGDLTSDDMNVTLSDYQDQSSSTTTTTNDPNSPGYDKNAQMAKLNNSTVTVKGSSKDTTTSDSIDESLKKIQTLANS